MHKFSLRNAEILKEKEKEQHYPPKPSLHFSVLHNFASPWMCTWLCRLVPELHSSNRKKTWFSIFLMDVFPGTLALTKQSVWGQGRDRVSTPFSIPHHAIHPRTLIVQASYDCLNFWPPLSCWRSLVDRQRIKCQVEHRVPILILNTYLLTVEK